MTHNTAAFQHVPGLQLDDWLALRVGLPTPTPFREDAMDAEKRNDEPAPFIDRLEEALATIINVLAEQRQLLKRLP